MTVEPMERERTERDAELEKLARAREGQKTMGEEVKEEIREAVREEDEGGEKA